MREILFRGKRSVNGEWVEGYYAAEPYTKNTYNCGYILENEKDLFAKKTWLVDSRTVGQYTGLTDKNGRKIFEGDCFKTYCAGLPVYKHIVGYYPEHFAFMARCIEMNTVHYLSDYRPSAIEVIGNIHDNPELLEVTE